MSFLFNIVISIFAFLVSIFLLVISHESGHFIAAKLCKINVERFSIGLGKPLWHFTKNKTDYAISPILLGGYIKLDEASFQSKSIPTRMVVMLSGVLASLILALAAFYLIFIIGIETPKPIIGNIIPESIAYKANLHTGHEIKTIDNTPINNWLEATIAIISRFGDTGKMVIDGHSLNINDWHVDIHNSDPLKNLGIESYQPNSPVIIAQVLYNSPASTIGLHAQDLILKINKHPINDNKSFVEYIKKHPDEPISLNIKRADKTYLLRGNIGSYHNFIRQKVGYLGIKTDSVKIPKTMIKLEQYSFFGAISPTIQQATLLIRFNYIIIEKLVTGKMPLEILGGPITIFSTTSIAFKQGLLGYINFLGVFSIMLAFINILPIPALDGGNFLLLLIEGLFGKSKTLKYQAIITKLGIAFLFFIMAVALLNDIRRLFD